MRDTTVFTVFPFDGLTSPEAAARCVKLLVDPPHHPDIEADPITPAMRAVPEGDRVAVALALGRWCDFRRHGVDRAPTILELRQWVLHLTRQAAKPRTSIYGGDAVTLQLLLDALEGL